MMRMVYDEVGIMGSRGSTRRDLQEATQLVGEGRIEPVIGRELELEQINEGLDLLRQGSVIGRAVIRFS
jgi:D-arabinose 1-dehydrogenase-like Zn-dependent alcohol dehydrogenase